MVIFEIKDLKDFKLRYSFNQRFFKRLFDALLNKRYFHYQ